MLRIDEDMAFSGSNVTIECVAVAEPPPKVTWSKVRDPQSFPNNRVEYIPGGLYLRNIVPEDTGEYICEISNGISPALQHKVLLHVQGRYLLKLIYSRIVSKKSLPLLKFYQLHFHRWYLVFNRNIECME